VKDKSIVGDLINFRGLVYSPTNENGVIFLFGKVTEDLNMYIEEIKPGFPDCVARRFTGRGWERVSIEFEYRSLHFKQHGHSATDCDLIVCWEHDWPGCPLEVVELREVIKSLPNKPIERPDKPTEKERPPVEDHLRHFPEKVGRLFHDFDERVKEISDEIWRKVIRVPGVTYYSPERVFVYVDFQKGGLKLTVFTRGEKLEGVKSFGYEKAGAKWGRIDLKDEKDLKGVLSVVKRSYELVRGAIKDNEPTGWYAPLEEAAREQAEEAAAASKGAA
jgi:hypothetical protein